MRASAKSIMAKVSAARLLLTTILIRLDCQAMGIYLSLFQTKKVYSLFVNLHQLNCKKRYRYRQQFLVAQDFLNLEYLFGIFLFFFSTTLLTCFKHWTFSCFNIELTNVIIKISTSLGDEPIKLANQLSGFVYFCGKFQISASSYRDTF